MASRIGRHEVPVRAIMPNAGEWQTATIAQSGTTSSEVDLGDYFSHVQVIIPELDSANISLTVSDASGGTFQTLDAASFAAGTGQKSTTFVLGGWQYVKVVASAAQSTAARSIKVRGVTL